MEAGEVSEETVLRELQEEVGHTAANLRHLASFWVAPGWATEKMHAYLATGLTPSKLSADDDENIQVVRVPFADAVAMIHTGEIHDGKTIAALLLAQPSAGTMGDQFLKSESAYQKSLDNLALIDTSCLAG